MASLRGEKKENKQATKDANKKLPSSDAPSKLAKSPKYKLRNMASREKMQQSSEQRSFDVIDANDEEDRVSNYSPEPSPINSPNVASLPSNHFVPVTVSLEFEEFSQFLNSVSINKNMVLTAVRRDLMHRFMPGDQISSFNQLPIWNRIQLERELATIKKQDLQKNQVSFIVIRAWNVTCLTKNQLERLSPPPEDHLHYFSVKVYCNNRAAGLYLRSEKKRMLVNHIRSKTPISFSLLVGDQILGINNELLVGKSTKSLYKQAKSLMSNGKKLEYIEIIACRPVLVRSSPAPSVDAELAIKASKTISVGDQVNKTDKKTTEDFSSMPLEADALEIAFRELTLLQQWIKTDSPLPSCDKGNSLLRVTNTTGDQTNSTTCTSEKSEYAPVTSTIGSPNFENTRKRGIFRRQGRPQQSISFTEQTETSKMTSDVTEETELKKCDPRSGIVSYIRNVFNN